MAYLPLLERLQVKGYGLYPGTRDTPGLEVDFSTGLTLVLGTNGLGKTTLVYMLYRTLTGPFDLRDKAQGELGQANIVARRLSSHRTRTFAARVKNQAEGASAYLRFQLGDHTVEVKRRLADLALEEFLVDGSEQLLSEPQQNANDDEKVFQSVICTLSDVPTFGDWLLLLRHLTFYFDDRRSLVWDPSAQRHVLRLFFLSQEEAASWTDKEQEIRELDSKTRNELYVLNRERKWLADEQAKQLSSKGVAERLSIVTELFERSMKQLVRQQSNMAQLAKERQEARRLKLASEQRLDSREREVERTRLKMIANAFPNRRQYCVICSAIGLIFICAITIHIG